MRKRPKICPMHNEPLEETNPADPENGPHPSDVETRLVCPTCASPETLPAGAVLVTLATDDSPDFWEVFGKPFEVTEDDMRFAPGWSEEFGAVVVARVHVVEAHPHAGDQDVDVYRVPDGRLVYFDAGPEYRWMEAPVGTDTKAWIADVVRAAKAANDEHPAV